MFLLEKAVLEPAEVDLDSISAKSAHFLGTKISFSELKKVHSPICGSRVGTTP